MPDCFVQQSIEIPDVDCECLDLIVDYTLENIPCDNEETAIIDLTSIQGTDDPDFEIYWQDGTVGQKLTEVGEGWHAFTINYDEHCIWEDSIFVELLLPISFEVIVQHADCPDLNTGEIEVINVTGGTNNYQFSIDDGASFQAEQIFSNLTEGIFNILVQDDANCISMQSIEIESPEIVEIQLSDIESIEEGKFIILDPQIDATAIDSFSWSPIDGILNPGELIIEVQPDQTTTYTFEIFYDGCYDFKTITIEVEEIIEVEETKPNIIFSNVFSPNGDNLNDIFYIQGSPGSQISIDNMSIFDRWGNQIFNKPNPKINEASDGWDGNLNGDKVISGVYVFMISYVENGEAKVKMGTITVVY